MRIDFDSFFRNRIECLLIRASWMGGLREALGIHGISQIWSGNAQWYFWLHDAPGAYCLSFVEGDIFPAGKKKFYEGRFALKCYPYSNHPGHKGYSEEERSWMASNRFDSTHTPCFEAFEQIPEGLFTVGAVSFLIDPQTTIALLAFESQDAFKTLRSMDGGGGSMKIPQVIRNVSGWTLGRPLFDCLVGLYANFSGQPPGFMGATRSPGYEYWMHPEQRTSLRTSHTARRFALSIGFDHLKAGAGNCLEALWRTWIENGEEVVLARKMTPIEGESECPVLFAPHPVWREVVSRDFRSELLSTCGCGDHSCLHAAGQCLF
jgi:hypothetical protein